MLKKSGIIALALLYLVTVLGFAMDLHFCGSYMASVHFEAPGKLPIAKAKCGMKMKCCKNQHLNVKVKDAHQSVSALESIKLLALHLPVAFLNSFAPAPQPVTLIAQQLRGPPDLPVNLVPVFLKNCNFRI
ncbi:hypothetical protein HH214_11095 [Mucilaginibacter robiniae]|uniref:Uncharacterized protein n=1 Tax=Mucilaginibacter robiniae TaxID=2728022 RepID=A0A7L5E6A4_9SPHI|nr:hypothetical protein [Mucilaginibacter robiniae]QJD96373.1 hypothetical protein HH214_11095 [Mucilaginibacter robiniae]